MFAKWIHEQIDENVLSSVDRLLVLTDNEPDEIKETILRNLRA